jgi:succinate dehydrogenase / fumarate reductase membrane anchor subunit
LLLLLGVHLAILHFVPANLNINVLVVATRLNTVLYFVVDGGLLAIGLYHGLNGLRSVLFDFVTAEGKRRWLNLVLWTVGLAFFVWGATALFVFLQ